MARLRGEMTRLAVIADAVRQQDLQVQALHAQAAYTASHIRPQAMSAASHRVAAAFDSPRRRLSDIAKNVRSH